MTDQPEPVPLDPDDPLDRRVLLTMRHLRVTAADLGPSGVDALRYRLGQDDGGDLSARLAAGPAEVADDAPADPIGDGIRAALQERHGES